MSAPENSSQVLRIATINLLNFVEPPQACYESDNIYSHAQWQAKCAWLTCYINRLQPDVIAFQEVFSPEALKQVLKPLGFDWFEVVEQPGVLQDYIFNRPVNAIASRFPVVASAPIQASANVCRALGIDAGFQFSRSPVWCRIDLPLVGPCDFYCVHFKSKRPSLEMEYLPELNHSAAMVTLSQQLGRASSSLMRGAEAAVLMHSIIGRRSEDKLPVALLGDFNDLLSAAVLDVLHVDDQIERWLTQAPDRRDPGLDYFGLRDSFNLHRLHVGEVERIPTHYWGGRGSVLDYILLSSEFDPRSATSTLDVTEFRVCDRHMFGPESVLEKESSDHAPVMVTLTPRI